jgi:fibronectin-binding autotransporter adhesin
MKPQIASSLPALAASALFFAAASNPATAATYTWDTTSGDGASITSGTGAWNTTAGNIVWNDGAANVVWAQTSATVGQHSAVFAGADGTANQYVITVGGTMAAQGLTFNNTGYQLTGGTVFVTTASATNGNITVAANKTATINSALGFANNAPTTITSNAGSTLNLGGGASNSQYTFAGAGTVNMTAGTYSANIGAVSNATFNQTGGTFNITPGANAGYNISSAARNVAYNLSGGTLSVIGQSTGTNAHIGIGNTTGTAFTSSLNVSAGTMNVGTTANRAGEIQIAKTGSSNGALNVSGGTVTVGTGSTSNKIYFFKAGSAAGYAANMTQSAGTVTTNGIQFGGSSGTYDATSSANLTLSGGTLYVGLQGITRGSAASALPTSIKLQGGTIGASDAWSSSLDMKLGATGGGPIFQAATSGGTSKDITLSGILSDDTSVNGTLTKTGAGTLTLSGSNTFTGGLFIKNGTVNATTSSSALGAGSITMGGAGSTGATLTIGRIFANNLTINAPDSGNVVIGANGSGSGFTLSGGITLNGNLNIRTFDNVISGVTKASAGITGGITGTGNVLLNNLGLAANTITFTTSAINHTGSLTLQGTATGDTTIGSVIGANVTSVTQNSATSRLVLSAGTTHAYTGATNVNAGTLVVNGNISTSSLTTVSDGATLGGSGTVGATTIANGGTLAPGNSPGTLNTGTLTLNDTSVLSFELNPTDTTVGSNINDLVSVTGNLTLDGILNVVATSGDFLAATEGMAWRLFNYTGTLTNNLVNFSLSMPTLGAGLDWEIDTATAGQVNLVVVPEPGAALLGGLGLLALLRRRRD